MWFWGAMSKLRHCCWGSCIASLHKLVALLDAGRRAMALAVVVRGRALNSLKDGCT